MIVGIIFGNICLFLEKPLTINHKPKTTDHKPQTTNHGNVCWKDWANVPRGLCLHSLRNLGSHFRGHITQLCMPEWDQDVKLIGQLFFGSLRFELLPEWDWGVTFIDALTVLHGYALLLLPYAKQWWEQLLEVLDKCS